MEYNEDFLNKMVQVGTLGYPLSKIINVLDIENEEQFKKDFFDEKSIIYNRYKKGLDKADFVIDSKLFEMSKNGDLKAMSKYQIRKTSQQQRYFVEKNNNKK